MDFAAILLVAFGLAMDAFAVSLAASGSGRSSGGRARFRLSFHFGLFQFLMPVIGWVLGARLAGWLRAVDHWIAFGLLAFVGIRMIRSGCRTGAEVPPGDPSRGLSLVALAVATSLDALAVGFSLALLGVSIWYPAAVIGVVTAALSYAGVCLGAFLGRAFGRGMEAAGGTLLLLIGLRILLEHLLGTP